MNGGVAQAVDLGPAGGTASEVSFEFGALQIMKCIEGVGAGQRVNVAHSCTPNVSRSRMRPSRIRVFAVPTGMSRRSATSVWV